MDLPHNKTVFSGIQPSGTLHLGNYLGAIKQWVALQEHNTTYYCIVDEHAITVPYDSQMLPEYVLDTAALYCACGLDPKHAIMFIQSHVPEHAELAWLLATTTPLGELRRMTQFKEKSGRKRNEATLGLFAYPILMAADILLYQTHYVPVGEDQAQHIELARTIARRFNNRHGEIFTLPKPLINHETGRIMSLTDPAKKMSKSDNEKSYIALTDDAAAIKKKVSMAVTETEPLLSFAHSGPAIKNLLHIYTALSNETKEDIEKKFTGSGYKQFKEALADLLVAQLTPIRERYMRLRSDAANLRIILGKGKDQARMVAAQTLRDVKEKMGLP